MILLGAEGGRSIRELDLGSNNLKVDAFAAIGNWLGHNPPCSRLVLWQNEGRDAGTFKLLQGLASNYSLHRLDLRDNGITDAVASALTDVLRRNLVLTRLKLQDNALSEEGIRTLSQVLYENYVLEKLEVVDNAAQHIPALPHLDRISSGLKRNRSFSKQKGEEFVASGMGLRSLPPQLASVVGSLLSLDLSDNAMSVWPEALTQLTALQRLSLARNLLSVLPIDACQHLTALVSLDLSYNRLSTLPAEGSAMSALRVMDVSHNLLEMLPVWVGRVEWESFRVEGNPLSCIPASTVAKGSRSILYHLKDLAEGGSDYCYRVKLLVTGQANVGKTSLLAALKNDVGSVNKVLRLLTGKGRRSSTLGISLDEWRPHDGLITFATWDFGGQLVYYATHQFFLSKRSLYVLVFSLASELKHNRILSWLNSIQSRAPGVSVMLVGTHLDDKRRVSSNRVRDVAAALRRTLASWERSFAPSERLVIIRPPESDVPFYPVSAISGEGVAEVRERLLDVAADQPSLRERVPRIYLQLLDVVRMRRRTENLPIVSWDRLREWSGFEDEPQLERAVQLLHDWGELLWFGESSTLRSVVVLSPQWLTSMFATIISPSRNAVQEEEIVGGSDLDLLSSSLASPLHSYSEESSVDVEMTTSPPLTPQQRSANMTDSAGPGEFYVARNGIVDREALPLVWADYDPQHYPYFEQLLETFELWLPLDGGIRFLVPALLPRRDPQTDSGILWELVRCGRSFWCPFPLHGFFERIIVQLLRLFDPLRYFHHEVLMGGSGTLKILCCMSASPLPNSPHGERVTFHFSQDTLDLPVLRAAVAGVMFVVHNFLRDWYNLALCEQVVAEAVCPLCCTSEQIGGTFNFEQLLSREEDPVEGEEHLVRCAVCRAQHSRLDLIVELSDTIHAVGNYDAELEELSHVADGSSSRVWQCRRRGEGQQLVAVKKLRVREITTAWFLDFLQEISVLQELHHEAVVRVEAAYLRPLCIVLEWIGGGTLDAAVQRMEGPHDWPLLLRILADVSSGLAYLHGQLAAPIVHRDIKSNNILVVELSASASPVAVKIGDLGSSCRSLGQASGRAVHNPRWKPPECFVGSGAHYTAASDVYCFGILMWEVVGRSIPYSELFFPSQIEDKILRGMRPEFEHLGLRDDYTLLMQQCWGQLPEQRPDAEKVVGFIDAMRQV